MADYSKNISGPRGDPGGGGWISGAGERARWIGGAVVARWGASRGVFADVDDSDGSGGRTDRKKPWRPS